MITAILYVNQFIGALFICIPYLGIVLGLILLIVKMCKAFARSITK